MVLKSAVGLASSSVASMVGMLAPTMVDWMGCNLAVNWAVRWAVE
jgi:hypothetical protein